MSVERFFYAEIPERELIPDQGETAARLKVARGYSDDLIRLCEKRLRSVLECRYTAVRETIVIQPDQTIRFSFGNVHSKDLARNLDGCEEAFLLAVTTGHGVDRLLQKLSVTSPAEYFVTDALASAFAEAACDLADRRIRGDRTCKPRFSPGYGDLSLEIQPRFLETVQAGKLLHITLNDALLMSPVKSITAIMGIRS